MELDILQKDEKTFNFVCKGVDSAFVNSLRRTIIAHIPTPAIDNVTIYENSSNIFDEFIAHRLGLIPIIAKNLREGERIGFVLDEEGPKTVMSDDIKGPAGVKVMHNIPIIDLNADQRIRLDAEVVWGIGKTHAKFQPALSSFKPYPVLVKNTPNLRAVNVCPRKALKIEAKKLILDSTKCNMCDECKEHTNGDVEVQASDDKFVFYVESFGQKEALNVIHDALNVLDSMCDDFLDSLRG